MSRVKSYNEEEVLQKAMHVFWNHGYGTTSVRLLEKEMGINQFSIDSSFSNKKNLFIEALKKYRVDSVGEPLMSMILRSLANFRMPFKDAKISRSFCN